MSARICVVSCLLIPLATTALAAPTPSDWNMGLGFGGAWTPEYRGADSHEAKAFPWIHARKGSVSINPVTGLSYDILSTQSWRLATSLSYAAGRDNTGALENFKDVHGSVMAGAVVSWTSGHWQLTSDIATPVSGDLEGLRVRGYLRYRGLINERWNYGFGPGMSWGNSRWNQSLFNVSAADAARAGLSAYHTEGDFLRASMNGRLTYRVTPQLSVSTVARYSRFFDSAADSPIVADVGAADQWLGSLAVNYQF